MQAERSLFREHHRLFKSFIVVGRDDFCVSDQFFGINGHELASGSMDSGWVEFEDRIILNNFLPGNEVLDLLFAVVNDVAEFERVKGALQSLFFEHI